MLVLPYHVARTRLRNGDILLWHAPAWSCSRAICAVTRSPYSHVGMAGLWRDRMMSLEVREWFGGRATLLSHLVAARPGACDVWRAEMANPVTALAAMMDRTGRPYPWHHLLHIAHRRLMPWIDHSLPMPDLDTLLVCSEAVGFALEVAGVNLPRKVRELAPGDLTKCAVYQFTLGV